MMYAISVSTKRSLIVSVIALAVVMSGQHANAQPGTVLSHQKISSTQGGGPPLDVNNLFGWSVVLLGDLDGDGVGDLAVGVPGDDLAFMEVLGDDDHDLGSRGAVWILFLNPDGTVKSHQKIGSTHGGFTGILEDADWFGRSVASLGDLDGDGINDLAVGALGDDDGGGFDRGAVWILFLNTNGTVKSHQKISDTQGCFTGILDNSDSFGVSLALLGDLDGDGVADLAVGATGDDDGGPVHGAVWILFLNTDGTVKSHQKISDTQGGFAGILSFADFFGHSVASLGDLDDDGVGDLAVGAMLDNDGGSNGISSNVGAVWVLFLYADGTVKSHQKISATQGHFHGSLDDGDQFGRSMAALGDFDGDGVVDLTVGAIYDDDGGLNRGAVWMLFLNSDGTVKYHQKISDTEGGFTGKLYDNYLFGYSVALLGDLNGDGVSDLAVGAPGDDDGGPVNGAVWVLFLDDGLCPWDLDNSGSVGTSDLLELFAQWGTDGPADFDGSGAVNTADLLILFANWGPCP